MKRVMSKEWIQAWYSKRLKFKKPVWKNISIPIFLMPDLLKLLEARKLLL